MSEGSGEYSMEPIPSLKILKYIFYDQFNLKIKQKKCTNPEIQVKLTEHLSNYQVTLKPNQSLLETTYTVFDLETTGFFPRIGDEIVSIGAIKMNGNEIINQFYKVINPINEVPEYIYSLTGLTKEQINKGITFQEAFFKLLKFSENTVLVAHPASFDVHFLQEMAKRWGILNYTPTFIDSYFIANYLQPKSNNKLDNLVSQFQIEQKRRHHALNDAKMTSEVFAELLFLLSKEGVHSIRDYSQIKSKKKGRLFISS